MKKSEKEMKDFEAVHDAADDKRRNEHLSNLVNKGQSDDKLTSLASRLQLLEKRLKGRVEATSEVESTTVDSEAAQPMKIIEAFSLAEKIARPSQHLTSDVKLEEYVAKSPSVDKSSNAEEKGVSEDVESDRDEDAKLAINEQNESEATRVEDSDCCAVKLKPGIVDIDNKKESDPIGSPKIESCLLEIPNADASQTKTESCSVDPSDSHENAIKTESDETASPNVCASSSDDTGQQKDEDPKSPSNDVEKSDACDDGDDDADVKDGTTSSKEQAETDAENTSDVDDQTGKSELKDCKDVEAIKKGKGIDAIARMLRKQQVKTEGVPPEDGGTVNDETKQSTDNDSSKPDGPVRTPLIILSFVYLSDIQTAE